MIMHSNNTPQADDYRFQPYKLENGDTLYFERSIPGTLFWTIRFSVHTPPNSLTGAYTSYGEAYNAAKEYLESIGIAMPPMHLPKDPYSKD